MNLVRLTLASGLLSERRIDRKANSSHWQRLEGMSRAGVERSAFEQGNKALSENGGHSGGHFDSDSVVSLKTRALEDLQRACKSIRRLEDLADDPAERKAAGRAVAILDKAFAELEASADAGQC